MNKVTDKKKTVKETVEKVTPEIIEPNDDGEAATIKPNVVRNGATTDKPNVVRTGSRATKAADETPKRRISRAKAATAEMDKITRALDNSEEETAVIGAAPVNNDAPAPDPNPEAENKELTDDEKKIRLLSDIAIVGQISGRDDVLKQNIDQILAQKNSADYGEDEEKPNTEITDESKLTQAASMVLRSATMNPNAVLANWFDDNLAKKVVSSTDFTSQPGTSQLWYYDETWGVYVKYTKDEFARDFISLVANEIDMKDVMRIGMDTGVININEIYNIMAIYKESISLSFAAGDIINFNGKLFDVVEKRFVKDVDPSELGIVIALTDERLYEDEDVIEFFTEYECTGDDINEEFIDIGIDDRVAMKGYSLIPFSIVYSTELTTEVEDTDWDFDDDEDDEDDEDDGDWDPSDDEDDTEE